jgi:cysteine synthase A
MRIENLVGNTPLIQISDKLYAKFETYNPSGSIKDRIVSYILQSAEKRGDIKPGDTIIEATSGNTGIALSLLGSAKGYKVKIIMPSNMSEERKQMIQIFGAEIIEVDEGDFDGAIALRDKFVEEEGFFTTNQFHNIENINCHYDTTGKEIVDQVYSLYGSRNVYLNTISAFVAGTGTGGTLMGVRKRLIEHFPNVKTVAAEPAESPVMSGGEAGLHGIQGIGDGSKFLVDLDLVDDIMVIPTELAKNRTCELTRDGLFVGISSGANILAAERWIVQNNPQGIVVTVLSDRGERYMSCL